jgi:hypothetical protein
MVLWYVSGEVRARGKSTIRGYLTKGKVMADNGMDRRKSTKKSPAAKAKGPRGLKVYGNVTLAERQEVWGAMEEFGFRTLSAGTREVTLAFARSRTVQDAVRLSLRLGATG